MFCPYCGDLDEKDVIGYETYDGVGMELKIEPWKKELILNIETDYGVKELTKDILYCPFCGKKL